MECNYHKLVIILQEKIWERIDSYYDWELFGWWLGDESYLHAIYRNAFTNVLGSLTDYEKEVVEKKGRNLESVIGKSNNLTKNCLQIKINEHIVYQLKKKDIKSIIGPPCC
jgi:hypothetical protein